MFYIIVLLLCQLSASFTCFSSEKPLTKWKIRNTHFLSSNVRRQNRTGETLHIAAVTPLQLSYYDGSKARINKKDNLPDPQYWVAENSDLYRMRFSHDEKGVNLHFVCKYMPDNSMARLLFDGNTAKYTVHAQVNDIQEQSKIYLFPATNKGHADNKEYDGEQFLLSTIDGSLSALTLDNTNNIIYCVRNNDTDSFVIAKPIIKTMDSIEQMTLEEKGRTFISQPLKKICPIGNNTYLCLSENHTLSLITCTTKESSETDCSVESKAHTLQFKDIAVDPESYECVFLDNQGNVYRGRANALDALERIHIIDKIKRMFVERISYLGGICSIIYHKAEQDRLASGWCEQITEDNGEEDYIEESSSETAEQYAQNGHNGLSWYQQEENYPLFIMAGIMSFLLFHKFFLSK